MDNTELAIKCATCDDYLVIDSTVPGYEANLVDEWRKHGWKCPTCISKSTAWVKCTLRRSEMFDG